MNATASLSPFRLQLRYAGHPRREPAARFVPGRNPQHWLHEMTGWSVPLAGLKLFVLPTSANDLTPSGVLVPIAAEGANHVAGRSQLYGRLGERLYLPIDAEITPPVSIDEWPALFGETIVAYVWHPVVGLVAFEYEDIRRVSDLLREPTVLAADWSHAQPGEALNRRLWAVVRGDVQSADEIIKGGADDIGSAGGELRDLSPRLGESLANVGRGLGAAMLAPFRALKDALSGKGAAGHRASTAASGAGRQPGVGQSLRDAGVAAAEAIGRVAGITLLPAALLASGMKRLLALGGGISGAGASLRRDRPPQGSSGGGSGPGWLEGLTERFWTLTKQLLSARQREINRLLKMLEDDPDEGLKYSIPFGGESAARGIASPTSSLMRQMVDFRLSGLGGGGPVDPWDISAEQQILLVERYRLLAEREVRLKRYRRAAYIYAKLLGDLSMAATVLMQGGHFREAAVLYRDKLNRPSDAARAFEQAGQFESAIEIYKELKQYETIGDLYQRLEQPDEAHAAYQQAVEQARHADDRLKASELLKQKLNDVDGALIVLEQGWPGSKQAKRCLEESFLLAAELGRHDHALERIKQLTERTWRNQERRPLVETFCHLVGTYPDRQVEDQAADSARVLTSEALLISPRQRHFLKPISQLAPEDRLLQRDCSRFGRLTDWSPQPSPTNRVRSVLPSSGREPRLVREIPLPDGVLWQRALTTPRGYYVAGYNSQRLVLVRGAWKDTDCESQDTVHWNSRLLDDRPLLMDVREDRQPSVALFPTGGPPLPPRLLPKSTYFPTSCTAETPGWLPDDALAVETSPESLTWILAQQDLTLTAMSPAMQVVANNTLLDLLRSVEVREGRSIRMAAREDGVCLALGNVLVSRIGQPEIAIEFDDEVCGIVASPEGVRRRLAVLFETGGLVFFGNVSENAQPHHLHGQISSPNGVFLRDGRLIIAGDETWNVYDTREDSVRLVSESPHGRPPPVTLLRTDETSHVAVLSERGPLTVFTV